MDYLAFLNQLLPVGIAVVVGYLLGNFWPAYFGKKGENLATKQDIKQITEAQAAVQNHYDAKLAEMNGEIQKRLSEHDTRFSYLHKRQGEVIDGLFKKIATIQRIFESAFVPLMIHAYAQPPIEEQLKQGFEAAIEFIRYYEQNSLYLDERTCQLIDTFNGKLKELWVKDVVTDGLESNPGIGEANPSFEVRIFREGMQRIVKEELPLIKSEIAKRMQTMLGVNQNGNS